MELIVGTRRVVPDTMQPIPGGIEARLRGEALTVLLDATFGTPARIEVMGLGFDRRPMDVAAIRMKGAATLVTLICAGPEPALN